MGDGGGVWRHVQTKYIQNKLGDSLRRKALRLRTMKGFWQKSETLAET